MSSSQTALIYLARHGQTIGNSQRTFLHPDKEVLNDKGKSQASLLGQHLSPIKFTRVFSSTFSRAMETSRIVVSRSENPVDCIVFDERLREWEPRQFEGRGYDDAHSLNGQGVSDDHPYKEFVVPGTEQPEEIIFRLNSFLKDLLEILAKTDKTETILIISHGYVVRVLMKYLKISGEFDLEKFEDELHRIYLNNTAYHKIRIGLPESDESNPECSTNGTNLRALIEFLDIHQDLHLKADK